MPDWVSVERKKIMEMYNAEVILISKEEGGFEKAIKEAKEYAKRNNAFLSNQFENEDNVLAHYETTGKEIVEKLNKDIDVFVSGIGTGGTLMGSIFKKIFKSHSEKEIKRIEPIAKKIEELFNENVSSFEEFENSIIEEANEELGTPNDIIKQFESIEKNTYLDYFVSTEDNKLKKYNQDIAKIDSNHINVEFNINAIHHVYNWANLNNKNEIVESAINVDDKTYTMDINGVIDGENPLNLERRATIDPNSYYFYFTPTERGHYTINYIAEDKSGNKSDKEVIDVYIGDTEIPQIYLTEDLQNTLKKGFVIGQNDQLIINPEARLYGETGYTSKDLYVKDNFDFKSKTDGANNKYVTVSVSVVNENNNTVSQKENDDGLVYYEFDKAGTYTITFTVTDSVGNVGTLTKNFKVTAKTATSSDATRILGTVLIVVSIVILAGVRERCEHNDVPKAFVSALVYGVLDRKITLDYVLSSFMKTPLRKTAPFTLNVLRTALYQIMFMTTPSSATYYIIFLLFVKLKHN